MSKQHRVERFYIENIYSDTTSRTGAQTAPLRVVDSSDLFASENEIGIIHQGALYRLRVTRGGKLILNK